MPTCILDYSRIFALHDGHTRIGRAQIDADHDAGYFAVRRISLLNAVQLVLVVIGDLLVEVGFLADTEKAISALNGRTKSKEFGL